MYVGDHAFESQLGLQIFFPHLQHSEHDSHLSHGYKMYETFTCGKNYHLFISSMQKKKTSDNIHVQFTFSLKLGVSKTQTQIFRPQTLKIQTFQTQTSKLQT